MRLLRKLLICLFISTVTFLGLTAFGAESDFREKIFPNGARLVYRQLPQAKTVTVRIIFPVGFLDEPQEYLEISHLVEHLVFRGNGKGSLSDSPDLMDQAGNYYQAFTTLNRTEYILESTAENLSAAFPFYLDLILHPAFDPGDLEKEKMIVSVERAMRTTPGNVFLTYINQLTSHQLDSKLQAIGREQIIAFHRQHYTVDQLTVIITGNFDLTEISNYLSSLPKPETKQTKKNPFRPVSPPAKDLVLEDYLPGEKYRLLFGIDLKKIKGKDLVIAKILPYILTYESRQYDYVTNRPLDYDNYLFNLGENFYLIFEYKDVQEEYTPELSKWHERNIRRYYKYLKAKDFTPFLKALTKSLENNLKLIQAAPGLLNEYYADLLFEPARITQADLATIKRLSSADLKKFVENYLENQSYHKVVIKAR